MLTGPIISCKDRQNEEKRLPHTIIFKEKKEVFQAAIADVKDSQYRICNLVG